MSRNSNRRTGRQQDGGNLVAASTTEAAPAAQPDASTPAGMIQMAVQQGADTDKLRELMNLKREWEADEARKAYVAAMAHFRATCPMPKKDSRVSYPDRHGKLTEYWHVKLSTLAQTVSEYMAPHGLSYRWSTEQKDARIFVTCTVEHEQGHSESITLSGSPDDSGGKNSIQSVGSTVRYLQRYTLECATGIVSSEQDDDGAGASGSSAPETITENQAQDLDALIDEVCPADRQKFLEYMKVSRLSEIPASRWDEAVRAVELKRTPKRGSQ